MNTATFYIINEDSEQASQQGWFAYVHFLCRHFTAQGAKLYINCSDKAEAELLAEYFWQVTPEQFIAHNLIGEGPKNGTPVEIGHEGLKPSWNRQLAINLANSHATFAQSFGQVVDFVPCEEKAKQTARERYKIYRQAGYQLQTIEIQHSES
ncbi:DNA polymerase III subunit chi [Vibrio mediterranei]|uniref:DNA polymerase III subunit chi n=1 Tax=Vibrio mediterranei TaxID=689 RepID=A0A2C9P9P3_9VIBR|nr:MULTISPECIES: DNA polymerase III subunit chi [Vibrio]ASI89144.1 DNA polymerase III subunit chi [Vibrio mediterranei]AYV21141.1 DNA polymerase III subunit chi [Vibrio mediterranei]EDL52639.1 DNA polymerase III subunit chi [Vibrio mediterranei AK1]MCF4176780.1 DNA polymerase III subunit chi [Vibrio sp. McD22-P3]MCG9627898.1 DNA polymerase III subunit chi [Vibrio mediterranei]